MASRLPRESDLRSLEAALADLVARRDAILFPSERMALDTMIRGLEAEIAARQRDAPGAVITALPSARLSVREKEILSHVLDGHSNAVIARNLAITEAAAKIRLKRLLRKIGVKNRTQATIWILANLPELNVTPRGFV